jgi:cytochrome d ubiquinol oxidase subunit I
VDDVELLHRLQFAVCAAFHYLFPQLSMGLAFLLVLARRRARSDAAAEAFVQTWTRLFALTFVFGVVTGIPLQFLIGASFAPFAASAGEIFGQALGLEVTFAFFVESLAIGVLLYGGDREGHRGRFVAAVLVWVGSWLSGVFVVAANAWMQHPVGHRLLADGTFELDSLGALFANPWFLPQISHTLAGTLLTGGAVVASVGALRLLSERRVEQGRFELRLGIPTALIACLLLGLSGDQQGQQVALHQPATLAAMEGLFETEEGAPLVLIGQPNMREQRLDNPIELPRVLSFLTHKRWGARVQGLDAFPRDEWPTQVPLLYYAYHIMVGLGTLLCAAYALGAWRLWRGRLFGDQRLLWLLLLLAPFPYIANTAGWLVAELGRQPWTVHGLLRTSDAVSQHVSSGNALFSLLGFLGTYGALALLYAVLWVREVSR